MIRYGSPIDRKGSGVGSYRGHRSVSDPDSLMRCNAFYGTIVADE